MSFFKIRQHWDQTFVGMLSLNLYWIEQQMSQYFQTKLGHSHCVTKGFWAKSGSTWQGFCQSEASEQPREPWKVSPVTLSATACTLHKPGLRLLLQSFNFHLYRNLICRVSLKKLHFRNFSRANPFGNLGPVCACLCILDVSIFEELLNTVVIGKYA